MGLAFPSAAVVRGAAVLDRRERMIVRLAVVDVREAIESAGVAAGDTNEVRLAPRLVPALPGALAADDVLRVGLARSHHRTRAGHERGVQRHSTTAQACKGQVRCDR